jgi:hypothetical protein
VSVVLQVGIDSMCPVDINLGHRPFEFDLAAYQVNGVTRRWMLCDKSSDV